MEPWKLHRLIFAFVVSCGAASIVAGALFGSAGLRTVFWVAFAVAAVGSVALRMARLLRVAFDRQRPVTPEDREQRRIEREGRRRAREGARRRYGIVLRGGDPR